MKKILVIGSANMDLSLNVYRVPAAGETLTDNGGVAYTPGGKGANAAAAFVKLGAEATFCAKLGQDVHGQQLYNYYKGIGLDTSAIRVDRDMPTGFATVIKEADGQNRIIYYPGANAHISTDQMIEAFEKAQPDALYIGFEISFESALSAARIAEAKGVPIFVDAAPASGKFSLESLPYMEIFSPNESETLEYTGIMPTGQDSSLRAALALWRRVRCKYIVIKQGARGCSIYDGKKFDMLPAERVDNVGGGCRQNDLLYGVPTDHETSHETRYHTHGASAQGNDEVGGIDLGGQQVTGQIRDNAYHASRNGPEKDPRQDDGQVLKGDAPQTAAEIEKALAEHTDDHAHGGQHGAQHQPLEGGAGSRAAVFLGGICGNGHKNTSFPDDIGRERR